MAGLPVWAKVISWSTPVTIADLNADRNQISDQAGFYMFTDDVGTPKGNRVLYIGETKNLRTRLPKYLVHFITRITTIEIGLAITHLMTE